MQPKIHFLSGLPRSGSTLLAAILRQNPIFAAGVQSALFDIVRSSIHAMSASESAMFVSDGQRRAVLSGIVREFYSQEASKEVVFDSNRAWCSLIATVADISPGSRVICCVRNPAWILDSIERLVQASPLRAAKMFNYEGGTTFARTELLTTKQLLAPSLHGLRQAWCGEHAERLVLVRYESLVERPRRVVAQLYEAVGLKPFEHDLSDVQYEEKEFDERLGLPGMHRISGPVAQRHRETILPPELFRKHSAEFWSGIGSNPKGVTVL
jgi:sulfotransferase